MKRSSTFRCGPFFAVGAARSREFGGEYGGRHWAVLEGAGRILAKTVEYDGIGF